MQLLDEKTNVEVSGNFKTSEFTIRATAKAFKILSSGLYKNKIRAVIREYSVNAIDSHIFAKTPARPIEVQLPGLLNPVFSVQDYGVSLDDHEIKELFTSYFSSNKTHTNDVTGAFGIGCCSGFSYSDSFNVIAVKNGIKRQYAMYLNEEGLPVVSQLKATKVTDPNSFKVEIPVQRQDFDVFRREAQFVFSTFKTKPIVTGNSSFKLNDKKPIMEESGQWEVYDSSVLDVFNESRLVAISGLVAYPIRLDQLGYSLYSHWLFNSSFVVLQCPIGTIPPTASREEIEYLPKTVQYLQKRIGDIEKVYQKKLEDELDKCDCFWDACIKYNSQPLQLAIAYKGKSVVSSKGNPLYDATSTANGDPQDVLELPSGYIKPKTYHVVQVQYNKGYKFYLDDVDGKGAHSRVNYDITNSSVSRAYIIKTTDAKKIKKFKNEIGILDRHITNISTLPDPPKKTRMKGTQKVAGYRLKTRKSTSLTYSWERLDQVPPGSLVVAFDNMYLKDKDDTQRRPEYLQDLLQNVPKSFGIDIEQVYALSEKKFAAAAKGGFKLFWDEFYLQLDKELKKNKADYELLLEYHNEVLNAYSGGNSYGVKRYPNIDELFDSLKEICPIVNSKFLDSLKVIVDNVQTLSKGGDAQKVINLTNETKRTTLKPSTNLRTLVDAIYEKAPLLHQIDWYDQSSYSRKKYPHIADSVAQYLKFVL